MQIDVGSYIAELLYEYDSMIIPGLGGFITRYRSAEIDQVQGKIHPPSKDLHFNNHLLVNDGVLINYVKEQHELSYEEAEKAVADYVSQVKAAIDRREIVIFPQVGRLYKDYEQKLQFLPDNTNFNTDSFGLPTVEFSPVGQIAPIVTGKERSPAVNRPLTTAPPTWSATIADWFQRYLPIIGALSIMVISFGLYFILRNDDATNSPAQAQTEEREEIPASRINTKPSLPGEAVQDDPEDIADLEEDRFDPTGFDTEGSTVLPGRQSAIIAVGLFGDQKNVNKLIEEIYKAGYEPYTDRVGGLMRVGIELAYENRYQVEDALRDVRRRFNSDAFVLQWENQ